MRRSLEQRQCMQESISASLWSHTNERIKWSWEFDDVKIWVFVFENKESCFHVMYQRLHPLNHSAHLHFLFAISLKKYISGILWHYVLFSYYNKNLCVDCPFFLGFLETWIWNQLTQQQQLKTKTCINNQGLSFLALHWKGKSMVFWHFVILFNNIFVETVSTVKPTLQSWIPC